MKRNPKVEAWAAVCPDGSINDLAKKDPRPISLPYGIRVVRLVEADPLARLKEDVAREAAKVFEEWRQGAAAVNLSGLCAAVERLERKR